MFEAVTFEIYTSLSLGDNLPSVLSYYTQKQYYFRPIARIFEEGDCGPWSNASVKNWDLLGPFFPNWGRGRLLTPSTPPPPSYGPVFQVKPPSWNTESTSSICIGRSNNTAATSGLSTWGFKCREWDTLGEECQCGLLFTLPPPPSE